MSDRPKIHPKEAQRYLKRFDPAMKLGGWIGGGGFGDVYELKGTEPGRVVKLMDTRIASGRRGADGASKQLRIRIMRYLQQEIDHMKLLGDCPRVMPLFQAGFVSPSTNPMGRQEDTSVAIAVLVMPKLTPLPNYVADHDFTEEDIIRLLTDIAIALEACAKQGIVHRDVKPDNIFVDISGDAPRFILGDFGISRRVDLHLEADMTQIGTRRYQAPELSAREPLRYFNSDLYSLGVAVYYLINHCDPYPTNGQNDEHRIPVITKISPSLFAVIEKMLERDPERRYHFPSELLRALGELMPSGGDKIVRRNHETAARECMVKGDYEKSIGHAKAGIKNGELSCYRLLAFSILALDPNDESNCERALRCLRELCLEADYISIFLRGYIHGLLGKWEVFVRDMKRSAEANCVPAQYYYGRALYYGGCPGLDRDSEEGLVLIQQAAEAGYYPALRIFQREYRKHPELSVSVQMEKLLQKEYRRDSMEERQSYILFL